MTVAQAVPADLLATRVRSLFARPRCGRGGGGPGAVGLEVELLPVRRHRGRLRPAPLPAVDAALRHDPALRADGGISFEPGGQLELSPEPSPTVARSLERMEDLLARARRCGDAEGISFLCAAVSPWHDADEIGLQNDSPRYRALQAHFDSIGPAGRRMMRQSTAVQVCVDPAGPASWAALNAAAPALAATFAASPLLAGRPTGLRSTRTSLYLETDPSRTAFDGRLASGSDQAGPGDGSGEAGPGAGRAQAGAGDGSAEAGPGGGRAQTGPAVGSGEAGPGASTAPGPGAGSDQAGPRAGSAQARPGAGSDQAGPPGGGGGGTDGGRDDRLQADAATYITFALDAGAILLERPGEDPPPALGVPFGELLQRGGRRPDGVDIDHHLTTLFPPVRPRGYLEVRFIDGLPLAWLRPAVCLIAILAADIRAAEAAGASVPSAARPYRSNWERAATLGMEDDELRTAALGLIDIALAAIPRLPSGWLPQDAERELRDLRERLPESHRCPADELLARHLADPLDVTPWM